MTPYLLVTCTLFYKNKYRCFDLEPANKIDDLLCFQPFSWEEKKCNWASSGFTWETVTGKKLMPSDVYVLLVAVLYLNYLSHIYLFCCRCNLNLIFISGTPYIKCGAHLRSIKMGFKMAILYV